MSRQFRYRMAALVLSGLIFGAPLLTNGTASAEQMDPGDRQVTFGGGMLGINCESRPSVESMTVPADTVVRVFNRTGHDAQLRLSGAPKGVVPENGSAELLFRRGTTSVLLSPECSVGDEVVPMLVTAEPSDAATSPGPMPAPTSTMMARPSGQGSPAGSQAGSALPGSASGPAGSGSQSSRSAVRAASEARASATTRGATSANRAMPQRGANERPKVKSMRGTTSVSAPAFAGMPPGDRKTILPATAGTSLPAVPVDGASQVVPADPATPASPVSPALPASPASPAGSAADSATDSATAEGAPVPDFPAAGGGTIAEPVAAVGPIRDGQPVGLLGLTALVCVLGVSVAAIRAIVSQRASRTNMA